MQIPYDNLVCSLDIWRRFHVKFGRATVDDDDDNNDATTGDDGVKENKNEIKTKAKSERSKRNYYII